MNIVSIVGARPQFIKAAPVSFAIRHAGHSEYLVHTGQHYDYKMSQVFFDEMGIPRPDVDLGVGSGSHCRQIGMMITRLEKVLADRKPDWVVVYGDTNSTLAGALAARKLGFPLAHVEAGLRSFNREMPEECNRVLADHCSDVLLCPTRRAVANLAAEGIRQDVHLVGDTMFDAVLQFSGIARRRSNILKKLDLKPQAYILATLHRPYNTDAPRILRGILEAFLAIGKPIIVPLHPRTRRRMADLGAKLPREYSKNACNVRVIDPVGYLDMLTLEKNAQLIMTDSGGMQKEAYFFRVPCVTMRTETEWLETVETGWNRVAGNTKQKIIEAATGGKWPKGKTPRLFGDGKAAIKILKVLSSLSQTPLHTCAQ